jgi:hypothetical protein
LSEEATERREGYDAEEKEADSDDPGEQELRKPDADGHIDNSGAGVQRKLTPTGGQPLA